MLTSILLPTMNRHNLLMQSLHSLYETTKDYEIELICMVDKDQVSARDVSELLVTNGYRGIVSFSTEMRGAGYCWNEALRLSKGDVIFAAGDDSIFHEGWLTNALDMLQGKFGLNGCVGINDLMNSSATFCTTLIFGRQFCKEILGGVIAPPILKYYCNDNFLDELSRKSGKFAYCEASVVEHIHAANAKRPIDDTDRSHMDFWTVDVNMLDAWRNRGRNIEWEGVI